MQSSQEGTAGTSLLDLPLLPTRSILAIPLLRRSDIRGLASASDALKQLGLDPPGLAGTLVATCQAQDHRKVSIRKLAADATGCCASVVVSDKASPGGSSAIELDSVLDRDLNEQQWCEAESDYCRRLLDGQAEPVTVREVADSFARLVRLNRCAMQLRDATVQAAQAPQAAAAAGAAAHASGPRGTAHGSCRLPEDLRQKLLQTLQRVALCDFQLLEWMGRAVPWTATAARAMQQAADAASGNTARTEKPCVQGAQQVMQPAQLPQQQQRFLGTLPQVQTQGQHLASDLTPAMQNGTAAVAGPTTPSAGVGMLSQPTHMVTAVTTTAECMAPATAAAAAGGARRGLAAAAKLPLQPPAPAPEINAGGGDDEAGAAQPDPHPHQQHSRGRWSPDPPRSGESAGAASSRSYSSRSHSASGTRPRSRSRSRSRSVSRSGSDSHSCSACSSGSPRSQQRRGIAAGGAHEPSFSGLDGADARSPSSAGQGRGGDSAPGGAEHADGSAAAGTKPTAAAPGRTARQEATAAKDFAATASRAQPPAAPQLPAAPQRGLEQPQHAGARGEPRDPRIGARTLPGRMPVAETRAAAAVFPTAAVAAAATRPPSAGEGSGLARKASRQLSELPMSDTDRRSQGPSATCTRPNLHDQRSPDPRPASRPRSPADRGRSSSPARSRGRSPARGWDRPRSRSRSRSLPCGDAQRDEAGVIESLELAWAKQLHGWLLRQPGRRALSIDVLSAGLGAPGPVFKALGRKPYRCWQRHPQLWEYHKHPRGMSELRAVVPTHGGGTSSSAPAAGRHATRAAGGDELAPRDYRQLAQAEARYVRELYAFLIRHPEGFEARELTRHNMDVPAAILRERKISTFLKYYQHLGIFRINNPPLGAPPEPLTVWAVRGRRAEEALEEVFDRLVASGERRQMDGGGR